MRLEARKYLLDTLARLAQDEPGVAASILDFRRIVAFRNILIHGYATVDDRIVWGVIENYLAQLTATVQRLLGPPA